MGGRTPSQSRTIMVECARLHLLGVSDSDIQRQTGVARSTLLNWRRKNAEWQAIVRDAQGILGREVAGHIVGLIPQAFRVVREAIEGGDARVAMQLLTASGALQSGGRIVGLDAGAGKSDAGITINVNVAQDHVPTIDAQVTHDHVPGVTHDE